MGVAIGQLLESDETRIENFSGKILVVDSFNILYQFLSTIRQQDGTPLKDSHGNITSHLSGLFFRTSSLMEKGLKLAFVFDGIVPELKNAERERRKALKVEALKEYEKAKDEGDIDSMKKFAQRTSILTSEMINDAKKLLTMLGLPVIQAASEGEAQAAYIVKKGEAYAVVSQDTDSLLFGAVRVIKNLTISGKKKMNGKLSYETIQPEILSLQKNLSLLNITQDQLIALSMLVGTDYNVGGIKGIGPKKGLDLVKKHDHDFEGLFKEVKWEESFSYDWKDVFDALKNVKVSDDYYLSFKKVDEENIIKFLVLEHDFSRERVEAALERIKKSDNGKKQKGLSDFF